MNNIENIVSLIENISLLELNELILFLQKKYNIDSSVTINSSEEKVEQKEKTKTTHSLFLEEIGSNKISIIKIIRELNNLGLRESKDLVESFPVLIKSNIDLTLAESIKEQLEKAGAKIKIT